MVVLVCVSEEAFLYVELSPARLRASVEDPRLLTVVVQCWAVESAALFARQ